MGAVIQLSPPRRAAVMAIIMAATLMVVLDSTIANVALPHMQASLGATPESIAWVLTSYIVATAIATPVTGWLADRLGTRALLSIAIVGFTVSSAACGFARSLELMVVARLVQGTFGAFILPLGQAVIFNINPPEKHPQAMTIWALGVMVGPVVGPWLGGLLTETWDWRWVFFINLPIGAVTIAAAWALVPGRETVRRRFDLFGFALLAIALGAFQLMLDRGTQLDWFDSPEILMEAGVAIGAAWMFVIHMITARDPVLPRALFADRNFVSAMTFATVTSGVLMAGAALIAPMLQRLMGYSVLDAGMMVMPRGLGTALGMVLCNRLIRFLDGRILILTGLGVIATSLHAMAGFDLEMGKWPILWTGLLQGIGLGLAVLPLNVLAFVTLPAKLRTEGAALYALMRNLGGSIAISITTLLIARNVQVSHADLTSNVTTVSMPFLGMGMLERIGLEGAALAAFLDAEINRQAMMIAYLDDYWLMMWAVIGCMPLILVMRRGRPGKAEGAVAIGE